MNIKLLRYFLLTILNRSRRNKIKKVPKVLIYPVEFIFDAYYKRLLYKRKQRDEITHIRCLVPFTRVVFGGAGNVTACCPAFTKVKSIGNMKNQTIEELWNGKKMERLRRLMLLGYVDKICFPNCPFLAHGPISIREIKTDNKQSRTLKEDLQLGKTKLQSHPSWFNLANWGACNLHCIMCWRTDISKLPNHVIKTHENLKNYYDKETTIVLTGDGDPLARSDIRNLLRNFPQDKYPNVRFELLTNGLLFNPKTWEEIKHCNYTWVNLSIDAATKGTYEKIRKGGNWETLMKSLELFKEAKKEGKFSHVVINITVMRSNYKEIPLFIEMARRLAFISYFSVIRGPCGDENFFEMNDQKTLEDLRRVLSDPNLYGEDVDMIQLSEYVPSSFKSKLYNHLTSMAYEKFLTKQ